MWTLFWDMYSGGGQKLTAAKIYIHAPKEEAIEIFKKKFGRDPYNITCTCCGEDYVVDEYDSLDLASEFHRRGRPLEEYVKDPHVMVIEREWS